MGIYTLKPRFQQSLRGVTACLVGRRVHPDHLTLAAVVLSALGGAVLYGSRWIHPLLLLIPPLTLTRTLLNALDGLVARDSGLARPWGEVLNEFCDRLADVCLFAGVSVAPGSDSRLGAAVLVLMLLSRYLGTAAKAAGGKREYGGVMGKADRMVYRSVAALLAVVFPALPVFRALLVVVGAGIVVTIVQRLVKVHRALQPPR